MSDSSWLFESNGSRSPDKKQSVRVQSSGGLDLIWRRLQWSFASPFIRRRAKKFARHVLISLESDKKVDINSARKYLHSPAKKRAALISIFTVCVQELFQETVADDITDCLQTAWHLLYGRIVPVPQNLVYINAMPMAAVSLVMMGRHVHCVFPNDEIVNREITVYKKLAAVFGLSVAQSNSEITAENTDLLLTTTPHLALNYLQATVIDNRFTSGVRQSLIKLRQLNSKARHAAYAKADIALFYDANYSLIDNVVTPYSIVSSEENVDDRQVIDKISARRYFNSYRNLAGFSVCSKNNRRYYAELYNCNVVTARNDQCLFPKYLIQPLDADVVIKKIEDAAAKHDVLLHVMPDDKPQELFDVLSSTYQLTSQLSDNVMGELFRVSRIGENRDISTFIMLSCFFEARKSLQLMCWLKINIADGFFRYCSNSEIEHYAIKKSVFVTWSRKMNRAIKKFYRAADKERWAMIHADDQIEAMLDFSSARE